MTTALDQRTATELAQRIINTMRPTPALVDWVETLTGLNTDRAWRTFRDLRDTTTDGLNIATFRREYDDDLARDRAARAPRPTAPPPVCEQCDGSGWIEVTDDRRHARHCVDADACHCHAAEPCRCTAGNQARAVLPAIHEQNDRKP